MNLDYQDIVVKVRVKLNGQRNEEEGDFFDSVSETVRVDVDELAAFVDVF